MAKPRDPYIKLPEGVDWKGSHDELVDFLDAVYISCPRSGFLDCGKKETKNCEMCVSLNDQAFLDRMVFGYRQRDPDHRFTEGEETLDEYLVNLRRRLDDAGDGDGGAGITGGAPASPGE